MRMDDNTEQRVSDARGKSRQDKKTPLLIRDDGVLYPNVPLVRKNPRFRPYYGDPKASLDDRMRFLAGLSKRREVVYNPEPEAPFDIGKASVDELLTFSVEQFGRVLDPNKPLAKLREEVYMLSQLPEQELTGGAGQTDSEGGEPDIAAAVAVAPAVAGLGMPPEGQAIEPTAPLRGGRQPRGSNAGRQRQAGAPAAEAA